MTSERSSSPDESRLIFRNQPFIRYRETFEDSPTPLTPPPVCGDGPINRNTFPTPSVEMIAAYFNTSPCRPAARRQLDLNISDDHECTCRGCKWGKFDWGPDPGENDREVDLLEYGNGDEMDCLEERWANESDTSMSWASDEDEPATRPEPEKWYTELLWYINYRFKSLFSRPETAKEMRAAIHKSPTFMERHNGARAKWNPFRATEHPASQNESWAYRATAQFRRAGRRANAYMYRLGCRLLDSFYPKRKNSKKNFPIRRL